MSEDMRVVYAKRQLYQREGVWFPLHIAYTPDEPESMYEGIAYSLSDGCPDGEAFDLAHAPMDSTPNVIEGAEEGEDDWFDTAHADSGFGEVRVEFEGYNTMYTF